MKSLPFISWPKLNINIPRSGLPLWGCPVVSLSQFHPSRFPSLFLFACNNTATRGGIHRSLPSPPSPIPTCVPLVIPFISSRRFNDDRGNRILSNEYIYRFHDTFFFVLEWNRRFIFFISVARSFTGLFINVRWDQF